MGGIIINIGKWKSQQMKIRGNIMSQWQLSTLQALPIYIFWSSRIFKYLEEVFFHTLSFSPFLKCRLVWNKNYYKCAFWCHIPNLQWDKDGMFSTFKQITWCKCSMLISKNIAKKYLVHNLAMNVFKVVNYNITCLR